MNLSKAAYVATCGLFGVFPMGEAPADSVPENDFRPRAYLSAFVDTSNPTSTEFDSLLEPGKWDDQRQAVGLGCWLDPFATPPGTVATCEGGADSASSSVQYDAGKLRLLTSISNAGATATVEVRDFLTFTGPDASVPVTFAIKVDGSLRRDFVRTTPPDLTGSRYASASVDAFVQMGGVFTEPTGDDLGLAVSSERTISQNSSADPIRHYQRLTVGALSDPYTGDLTHELFGTRDEVIDTESTLLSVISVPAPGEPAPPNITVQLPTGTPVPVILRGYATANCVGQGLECSARADFSDTIYVTVSVPSGYTLASQGGFNYSGSGVSPAPANPGSMQFTAEVIGVDEAAGTVTLQVTRSGGSDAAASVHAVTRATGSATAGQDFTQSDVLVTFAAGDATAKSVSIPILEDNSDEPTETFEVELTDASGATLGSPNKYTVRINDNDVPLNTVADTGTTSQGGGGSMLNDPGSALLALLLAAIWWARAGHGQRPVPNPSRVRVN